jgi:hypothetical protein
MRIATTLAETVAGSKTVAKRRAYFLLLLMIVVSGCTAISNSAGFYQDIPRRPINWREYTSD